LKSPATSVRDQPKWGSSQFVTWAPAKLGLVPGLPRRKPAEVCLPFAQAGSPPNFYNSPIPSRSGSDNLVYPSRNASRFCRSVCGTGRGRRRASKPTRNVSADPQQTYRASIAWTPPRRRTSANVLKTALPAPKSRGRRVPPLPRGVLDPASTTLNRNERIHRIACFSRRLDVARSRPRSTRNSHAAGRTSLALLMMTHRSAKLTTCRKRTVATPDLVVDEGHAAPNVTRRPPTRQPVHPNVTARMGIGPSKR